MTRNLAGQVIGGEMINATTGAAFVGTVTCYVKIDQGAQALGTVGAGVCTAKGNGLYDYAPSAAETDGLQITYTFVGTGAIPASVQVATVTAAQVSALQTATGVGSILTSALCADALHELNIIGVDSDPSDAEARIVLGKLNRLLDNLNAERAAVYAAVFTTYTLTPALNPHTIGPSSATFVVTQRPQTIDGASLLLGTGATLVRQPIEVHQDPDWYGGLNLPNLSQPYPTDLYYAPVWPNGQLYFVPIPSTAYAVELMTRQVLGHLVLADTFWLPPGYQDAITLTLAEHIATPFGREVPPTLERQAMRARAIVWGNNDIVPRVSTIDTGMPGNGRQGGFNYRTGGFGR